MMIRDKNSMTTHHTHCGLRLGDNLAHLHFLRKLARLYPTHEFIHRAHTGYLPQLIEVVCDLPNIQLLAMLPGSSALSHDAWKNADDAWENHPRRNDYAAFMIEHFERLAGAMDLVSPIKEPRDLLFDYPALFDYRCEPIDFLIVNSAPLSNQWPGYDAAALDALAAHLSTDGRKVVTTRPVAGLPCTMPHTVTGIGGISVHAKHIIAVSTGPSWPTFNVWNADTCELRIILIEHEWIGLCDRSPHCSTVDQARHILIEHELL